LDRPNSSWPVSTLEAAATVAGWTIAGTAAARKTAMIVTAGMVVVLAIDSNSFPCARGSRPADPHAPPDREH